MPHHIDQNREEPPAEFQAVVQHYIDAVIGDDVDAIASDYAENACVVTQGGIVEGRDAIRNLYSRVARDVRRGQFEVRTQSLAPDMMLVGWAKGTEMAGGDIGVDTFVFRDGAIQMHTTGFDIGPAV